MTPTPKEIHDSTLRCNALYQKWLHREAIAASANRDSAIASQRWLDAVAEHNALEVQSVVFEAEDSELN